MQVDVVRSGRRFDATADLDLAADAATVWATITDYAALPAFMPGIRACRVLKREPAGAQGERLEVEQTGEFRFLLFAQAMTVRLDVEHRARRVAVARAVRFDLGALGSGAIRTFDGRYEIGRSQGRGAAARTALRYTAVIELALPPPPAIGHFAVRQNLAAQLEAVAAEAARRRAGVGDG